MSWLNFDWVITRLRKFLPSNAENDDVPAHNSSLNKKRLLKDTIDFVDHKKRKCSDPYEIDTHESDCEIIDVDNTTTKMKRKKRGSVQLKENKLSGTRGRRMVEMALNCNEPKIISPKDTSKIYCIDDDDANCSLSKPSDVIRHSLDSAFTNAFRRTRSQTKLVSLEDNQDSKNFTPTLFSSRPPPPRQTRSSWGSNLILPKVRKEQEQQLLMRAFDTVDLTLSRNFPKGKSSPLSNSTIHNTNQNQLTIAKHPYALRSSSSINSRSLTSNPKNFYGNATGNPIGNSLFIDLTNDDDDESQRKAITEDVLSSSSIQNYKSSFIGKNRAENGLLEFDSLLRKYNSQDAQRRKQAIQIEKQLKNRNAEMFVALEDIIKHRLSLKDEKSEEEESEKTLRELKPITKEMQMEMRNIISKKYPLAHIKDTVVKIQDIKTLESPAWLNDEVINAYMNLIILRSETYPDRYPKVHCFNTFLYEQLNRKGYGSVRRWTRKVDIFDFTILIVPIHLRNHWTLVQIRFDKKFIRYYDSMGSPNDHCLNTMASYLVDEYADKKKSHFDLTGWELINVPSDEIPQQRNAHDCGVFACTYAEYITRNANFNFDQEDMEYYRLKMMYEILTEKLL